MRDHPYKTAPSTAFWKRSVSSVPYADIDLLEKAPVEITRDMTVVSAGSCFAANIAKFLVRSGYNYLVTENLHPTIRAINPDYYKKIGYGVYSAQYGNIYTPRQMYQLLLRAYGLFTPVESRWIREDGCIIDPFRPALPHPASCEAEFDLLQQQHFAAVRAAFEQAETFIFTLGLTEAWRSSIDGAVFPVCPGTIEGTFDPTRHEFINFTVDEIYDDIKRVVEFLRARNSALRFIVTVSPVPLVATAAAKHVVVSTIYSKSVLRVAAEMAERHLGVYYFPSYEIITGPQAGADYFEADRRTVSQKGIDHVMRLFFRHLTADGAGGQHEQEVTHVAQAHRQTVAALVSAAEEAACEEELVEISSRAT